MKPENNINNRLSFESIPEHCEIDSKNSTTKPNDDRTLNNKSTKIFKNSVQFKSDAGYDNKGFDPDDKNEQFCYRNKLNNFNKRNKSDDEVSVHLVRLN